MDADLDAMDAAPEEPEGASVIHEGLQEAMRPAFDGVGVMVRGCVVAEWMTPDGETYLATWRTDSTMSWHARGMHLEAVRMLDDEGFADDEEDDDA